MIKVSSALSAQAVGLNQSKSGLLFTSRFTSVSECDGSTDGSTVIVQSSHSFMIVVYELALLKRRGRLRIETVRVQIKLYRHIHQRQQI